jgi:hypothetical protein
MTTKQHILNSCRDCMFLRAPRDAFDGEYCMYLHRFVNTYIEWFPADCPHPNVEVVG